MKKNRETVLTRKNADKFALYLESVQNPPFEIEVINRFYRDRHKKSARLFKEDFCGTFMLCCEWVKRSAQNQAYGIDLDRPTLDYGRKHHLSKLTADQQSRLLLKEANVLEVTRPAVDIVAALNFSYWLFKTREALLAYFQQAHRSLLPGGMLVLDAFGGSNSYLEVKERRRLKGFNYVWEHAEFSPVTSELKCKIHFEFRDGTVWKNAFTYDWRLWTLPELRELLLEAGFKTYTVYWEGTDPKTGRGNAVYRPSKKGEACLSWVSYIVSFRD